MTCLRCGGTGWAFEWDETVGPGYVDIECPECQDGDEPNHVAEAGVVLTQAEIEAEAYPFLPLRAEAIALEEDMAWAQHGSAW